MVKIAPDDADAAVTEEDFPGKNQRADSKGNVVFLCIYLNKRRGGGCTKTSLPVHPHTICCCMMSLLLLFCFLSR